MVKRSRRARSLLPSGRSIDRAGLNPRRDQDRRNPHSKPFEIESLLADRVVWCHRVVRRRHVIVVAAVLIVGDYEQRALPDLAAIQGVINVVKKLLAL